MSRDVNLFEQKVAVLLNSCLLIQPQKNASVDYTGEGDYLIINIKFN